MNIVKYIMKNGPTVRIWTALQHVLLFNDRPGTIICPLYVCSKSNSAIKSQQDVLSCISIRH